MCAQAVYGALFTLSGSCSQHPVTPGREIMYICICSGYLDGFIPAGSEHPHELVNFPCTTQTWAEQCYCPCYRLCLCWRVPQQRTSRAAGGSCSTPGPACPRDRTRVRSGEALATLPGLPPYLASSERNPVCRQRPQHAAAQSRDHQDRFKSAVLI